MPSIPYLNLNRGSGILGAALLPLGMAGVIFGIVYLVNSSGWAGGTLGKVVWLVLGAVTIVLSLGISVLGGVMIFYNSLIKRKENRGEKGLGPEMVKYFDLNRIEGALSIPMLSLSAIFLLNGIIFYISNKILYEPQNQILKRAAREYRSAATWMFVLMFGLWVAAGICLFVNRYFVMQAEERERDRKIREGSRKKEAPKKKDKPKKEGSKKKENPPPPPPPPED